MTDKAGPPLLQVNHVCKSFPGVRALDDVSIELHRGEVLCLAGENGAGKSTLIKILSGVHQMDSGEILIEGEKAQIKNPQSALDYGFSVVYQEHRLFKNLTVAENIYFGRFPTNKLNLVNHNKLNKDVQDLLDKIGLKVKSNQIVDRLSSSQSQMVEIAKALSIGSKIMILDEPSAAITDVELEKLFSIIKLLKEEGKSFIYISHRLNELFVIGDRVAILKDGKLVSSNPIGELTTDKIVSSMVGRNIGDIFRTKKRNVGEEILKVKNLTNDKVKDCSFVIRAGEIVGFSGLVGSGRSELAESVFGYRRRTAGEIFVNGVSVDIKRPADAIRNRIGFITEDRKTTGLILNKTVGENISFAILTKLSKFGFVNVVEEKKTIQESIVKLNVKTPSESQEAQYLSGGNQQKVILAKWLLTESKILICDEPTKGIDVGTKQEFYNILDDLAREGIGIMLISSELPEIIGLSNRVYVMQEGRITKELLENEIDEEKVAEYAMKGLD